jgi:hypothetical protein
MKANSWRAANGTPREKIHAGRRMVGDVIPTHAGPHRIVSLGRPWTDRGWVDEEDARSGGREGQTIQAWQYAYLAPAPGCDITPWRTTR